MTLRWLSNFSIPPWKKLRFAARWVDWNGFYNMWQCSISTASQKKTYGPQPQRQLRDEWQLFTSSRTIQQYFLLNWAPRSPGRSSIHNKFKFRPVWLHGEDNGELHGILSCMLSFQCREPSVSTLFQPFSGSSAFHSSEFQKTFQLANSPTHISKLGWFTKT